MNCLIPANCSAGIYFTPCFEASQVVPQKKQTMARANMAFAFLPFFRIVNGLSTDSCFKESPVWDSVLFMSKRGIESFDDLLK
jgi:hypothetical protein